MTRLSELMPDKISTIDVAAFEDELYGVMNDDFNSPMAIAKLFDGLKWINSIIKGDNTISKNDLEKLKTIYNVFYYDILGLQLEEGSNAENEITEELMDLILAFRKAAKEEKDFTTADKIRDKLGKLNIIIKDGKDGAEWSFES